MPTKRKRTTEPTPIRPSAFVPITLSKVTALKLHQKQAVRIALGGLAQGADQDFQNEFASVCETLGIDPNVNYNIDFQTRKLTIASNQPEPVEDEEPEAEDEAE